MIFNKLTLFLLIPLTFLIINGDRSYGDKRIDKIKDLYDQAKQLEMDGEKQFYHEVTINTMQAAIGLQTTKIRFIYKSWQADPKKDPYLLNHQLLKVIVRYNISASVDYLIEYLYDKKGNLVFYFWQEKTSEIQEKRYYFENQKLIQVIMDSKRNQGNPLKYTSKKSFKKEDLQNAKLVSKKAKEYMKLFRNLLQIEQIR